MTTRVDKTTRTLTGEGGALDLGPDKTRLLNRMIHLLAQGSPLSKDNIQRTIAELGVDQEQADALIDAWTERDEAGNVVGLGITYNPTAHRMTIDGAGMWAWCALDTLIFAHVLRQQITIESAAPGSNEFTRLEAGPEQVSHVEPAGAVVTWPIRGNDQVDMSTTTAIWGTFCHHSFFFPSREQAELWAAGREDIEILSLDEGFAIAQEVAGAFTRYEPNEPSEQVNLELNKADATATLTAPARRLHLAVLEHFAETGQAPTRADLVRIAHDYGIDPDGALRELAERDVVAFDAGGEIRAAYPFSPTPTGIQVSWDGGPAVHSMCAVDALGISAMLDRPVTITAAEPGTDAAVTVHVERDKARWTPESAVVFAGTTGQCCPSVDGTCGHINFFTSAEAASRWAADHPEVTGLVLNQTDALACGIAEFGALMDVGAASPG